VKRKIEKPYRGIKEITTERRGKREGEKTVETLTPKRELGTVRERIRALRFHEFFKRAAEQIDYIAREPSQDIDETSIPEYEEFVKVLEKGDKNDNRPFVAAITDRIATLRALRSKIEKEIQRLQRIENKNEGRLKQVQPKIKKLRQKGGGEDSLKDETLKELEEQESLLTANIQNSVHEIATVLAPKKYYLNTKERELEKMRRELIEEGGVQILREWSRNMDKSLADAIEKGPAVQQIRTKYITENIIPLLDIDEKDDRLSKEERHTMETLILAATDIHNPQRFFAQQQLEKMRGYKTVKGGISTADQRE